MLFDEEPNAPKARQLLHPQSLKLVIKDDLRVKNAELFMSEINSMYV